MAAVMFNSSSCSSSSSNDSFVFSSSSLSSDHHHSHHHHHHHHPIMTKLHHEISAAQVQHARKNLLKRVPFPLPKKLGSDRLLLVSKALDDIPQYKKYSEILQTKRTSSTPEERRVHFSPDNQDNDDDELAGVVVETIHEYEKDYDEWDHYHLWFSPGEFAVIFDRDDEDFAVCFNEMQHTKQILQLWGMCSRGGDDDDNFDARNVAAKTLLQADKVPIANARGLEGRIITGIRNHRQKAVQSFLQSVADNNNNNSSSSQEDREGSSSSICPRYLKFSQAAARFAQALAEGDAHIAQQLQQEEAADDQHNRDGVCSQ